MTQVAAIWNSVSGKSQKRSFAGSPQEREATLNLAARAANLLGRNLGRRNRERGAAIIHYANGAALGALYAIANEFVPAFALGRGAAFGAFFWYFGDQVGLPALALLHPPRTYSAGARLNALCEHMVYGLTVEFARRTLRRGR